MGRPYYSDFPTVPIGGSNPYHMCKHCEVSVPEINGDLKNHRPWCEYRKRKEAEILDETQVTMSKVRDYIKDHLTITADISETFGIEVRLLLDGEEISSDIAPIRGCCEKRFY